MEEVQNLIDKKIQDLLSNPNNLNTELASELTSLKKDVEALFIDIVSNRRELFLGFENTHEFTLYEAGIIEFKNAFESYLAQI